MKLMGIAALLVAMATSAAHAEAILVPADLDVVCVHGRPGSSSMASCPERLSKVPVVLVTSAGLASDETRSQIEALVRNSKAHAIVFPVDLAPMCTGSFTVGAIACRERLVRSPEVLVISKELATPEVVQIIERKRGERLLALNQK